jgi:hypothetical protein
MIDMGDGTDKRAAERREGRSVLVEDQASFIDEHPRAGKQYGDGRKVTDLERVGAMSPDADASEAEPPKPTR